ncbi:hypothetical protein PMAYCL1PPCAC_32097, partial [Pristionchus mayeri]
MDPQYGLAWDRDFLLDILHGTNSVLPIVSSLTIYPANFYLLIYNGPAMNWEIRAAYLINIIAHMACDWIFTIFVRANAVPPFGLFYCEGLLTRIGCSKRILM